MQCVTTTPISGQEGGHSSLSSPQLATALPTARVDVPGVGQGCAPSPGHRGPHPCGPACPPQPVKTNGAEPTMCGHLSRGIQTPQAQGRRALGVPGGVGAAKSWGEAESQCPAPVTAIGAPPGGSLEPKVPHGQGPSPQGCCPRGTQPCSRGWAGCGSPGRSRPAGGDHPAGTLGVPKQGVPCGPWRPALPLSSVSRAGVQPQSGAGGPWRVPEQDQCPVGCPRAAPVLHGMFQNNASAPWDVWSSSSAQSQCQYPAGRLAGVPVLGGMSHSRTPWCCPSLPGTVTHPTGTSSTSWGPHACPQPQEGLGAPRLGVHIGVYRATLALVDP